MTAAALLLPPCARCARSSHPLLLPLLVSFRSPRSTLLCLACQTAPATRSLLPAPPALARSPASPAASALPAQRSSPPPRCLPAQAPLPRSSPAPLPPHCSLAPSLRLHHLPPSPPAAPAPADPPSRFSSAAAA